MRNVEYRPVLYMAGGSEDRKSLGALVKEDNVLTYDTIRNQVLELMLCRHPALSRDEVEKAGLVDQHLSSSGGDLEAYGTWVYYPWSKKLVHILGEEEFIEVRTDRNRLKIKREEQAILRTKRLGIAGLSVGRSIALLIAVERLAGEIRLADFDRIELSNLNRMTAPLTELGENKAIATARQIAEIDPYLKVLVEDEGLTRENLRAFLNQPEKLDVFIEECDNIPMKIISRQVCKELRIPVIMETNDRGQVDIERFDLEPDREIFHGKVSRDQLKIEKTVLAQNEVLKFLYQVVNPQEISMRMKESIELLGEEVRSWPQLASDVFIGSGVVTTYIKEILLTTIDNSGTTRLESKRENN